MQDGASVRLNLETGEFNARLEAAERNWAQSTGQMSREALKLELAQDRLRSSLAKYGAESKQAKAATISLKDAEEAAARAADRAGREHQHLSREVEKSGRSMRSMAGSVSAVVGVFGGAYGLVSLLRSSVSAAREAETVQSQLANAVKRAGLSYEQYAGQINKALQAQSKLTSFDDEALAQSFTTLIRRTKDVSEALRLNALAANVARGRHIELDSAANIVLKAYNGQVGGLRRLGIEIGKNATATEALAKLQQAYGRSAATFADTSAGKQEHLNKVLGDSEEIIGGALLPAVDQLASSFSKYLESLNDSGELQAKISSTLDTVSEAAHGAAEGFQLIRDVTGPVIDVMGGLDNAAQTFLILGALAKLRRFIGGFTLLRTTSAATRSAVVADIAAMSAASGVPGAGRGGRAGSLARGVALPVGVTLATMVDGSDGVSAGDVAGRVGGGAAAGFGVGGPPGAVVGALAGFFTLGNGDLGDTGRVQRARWLVGKLKEIPAGDGKRREVFLRNWGLFKSLPPAELRKVVRDLLYYPTATGVDPNGNPTFAPVSASNPGISIGGPGAGGPSIDDPVAAATPRPTDADFTLNLLRAGTDSPRALQLLIGRRRFLERKVAEFQRKGFTDAETRFRQELEQVRGQIQGIYQERQAARDAAKSARDARRAEAADVLGTNITDAAEAGARGLGAAISVIKTQQQVVEERKRQALVEAAKLSKQVSDAGTSIADALRHGISQARKRAGVEPTLTAGQLLEAQQDFLRTQQTFATSLAPNTFGGGSGAGANITVNQNFLRPPSDQHAQARYARYAMAAQFLR